MKKRYLLFPLAILPILAALVLPRQPIDSAALPGGDFAGEPVAMVGNSATSPEEAVSVAAAVSAAPIAASGVTAAEEPTEARDVLREFEEWVAAYLKDDFQSVESVSLDDGVALAELRLDIMKNLIQEDPEAAIAAALPVDVRDALPMAIQSRMERTVSGRGDLDVLGIAPRQDQPLPDQLVLRHFKTEGELFNAFVYGRNLGDRTAEDIFLHGIAIDQDMAVNEDPVRKLSSKEIANLEEEPEPCPVESGPHSADVDTIVLADTRDGITGFCDHVHYAAYGLTTKADGGMHVMNHGSTYATHGEKTVLVIRVDFETPDGWDGPPVTGESVSVEDAYATMAEVGEFFLNSSYRQFRFSAIHVTAGDPLRMPHTPEDYQAETIIDPETGEETTGLDLLMKHANAAAEEAGYTAEYDFVLVAFPQLEFPFAGLGAIGGKKIWMQDGFSAGTAAHEMGHNFGLSHASYWEPLGPVDSGTYPNGPAFSVEYGNVFDVMGGGPFPKNHFSGNFKNILGWIPDERVARVEVDAEPGTHRIYRIDGGALLNDQRFYSLQVVVQDHGALPEVPVKDYWVDFRQLFTEAERAMNGVVVQWGDTPGTKGGNHLVNVNRNEWGSDVRDAPLMVGETFVDPVNEVILTPTEIGGSGAAKYIDVIVTRGQLAVELLEPQSEFSIDNPTGETTVAAFDTAEFRASVTATGSPAATVEFVLDGISFPGEPVDGEPGIYSVEVPTNGWGDEALELICVVTNEAGNVLSSEPVLFRFVEPQIDLFAEPATVVLGDETETIVFSVEPMGDDTFLTHTEIFVADTSIGLTAAGVLEWPVSLPPGTYSAYAVALDQDGIEHRSRRIDLRIFAQGDLSYTFHPVPTEIILGETIDLSVTLGEEDIISSVGYFANGRVIDQIGEAPYALTWEPTAPGTYQVNSAVIQDLGTTVSPVQTVTVVSPVLGLDISPRIARPDETFSLAASVNTPSWEPSTVEYWVNDALYLRADDLGGITFVPEVAGVYHVEVHAWDQYGNAAVSAVDNLATHATFTLDWSSVGEQMMFDLFAGIVGEGRAVIGGASGTLYYSDDGQVWTPTGLPLTDSVLGLAYGNGLFVAVGEAGLISTSEDAQVWEQQTSGVTSNLRDVGFHNGVFMAVGDKGVILYSDNGVTWTRATSPETPNTLWQSTYGAGTWVAVGQAGMVLVSNDGIHWTAQNEDTTLRLRGVAFGKGTFVIVGGRIPELEETEGIIMTSSNGIDWEQQPREEALMSVVFGENAFLATGRNGTTLGSFNGIDWTTSEIGGGGAVYGSMVYSSRFYAFGEAGLFAEANATPTTYPEWLAWNLDTEALSGESIFPEASIGGGVSNLMRYALGLDPWASVAPDDLPHLVRLPDMGEGVFSLSYRQIADATDVNVVPETSVDLQNWAPLDTTNSVRMDRGGVAEITVNDAAGPDSSRRFYRLNIHLNDPW